MRTLRKNLLATLLLITSSSSCFALNVVMEVTREQAREWDVVIKSREAGDAGIWVWLELKTQGKWERIQRVELVVNSAGRHLVTAPLAVAHPTPDSITAGFSAHPSTLKECELRVCVNSKGSIIYRFKLKDFIDLEKISAGTPQKKSTEGRLQE